MSLKTARLVLFVGVMCGAVPLALSVRAGAATDAGEVQLQLGELLFAEGRYLEAVDAYGRAARGLESRRRVQATIGLVKSLLRIAEFGRARQEARWLQEQAPRDPHALGYYGDALWAGGLFEEAEEVYRNALSIDPEAPRARHGLARIHAARNRLDDALREAQAALARAPRDPEFHHTVGWVYVRKHRFEEAAAAYGNYVNLLPNREQSDKAAWARAEIRFLRSFGRRVPYEIENDSESMLHTVEFRLIRDKVVVRGSVNGSRAMDFVVDTGSEQTVVSRRTAQRNNIPVLTQTLSAGVGEVGLRGLQVGRLDSFQVGTLKVRNVPVLIKNPPLTGLPTREGESFSPLALGLSMTVDYARRRLTIGRQLPIEPADHVMPLWVHRLAMVRGTVDGEHPVHFIVDTGGEVISISTSTASQLDARPGIRRIPLKVYGISGWDRDAFLLPGVDLDIDTIRYSNFPVVVLNLRAPSALLGFQIGGILGHRFLSPYRVTIDLGQAEVRLARL